VISTLQLKRPFLFHPFMTNNCTAGQIELAELDGPFVKISLRGRFWHERSMDLSRVGNYLKQRIPVSPFTEVSLLKTD